MREFKIEPEIIKQASPIKIMRDTITSHASPIN